LVDQPPIHLQSGRLAVEIASPGAFYRRARFDWSGFITQVTLDGLHTFCAPEDPNPRAGSGGIGLCSEFGNEKIPGYASARPGETFPKPGVGLLVRPDRGDYNFFHEYEVASSFPVQVDYAVDWARFTVEPLECRGIAFREVKTVQVAGNSLELTVRLENTGSQPIHTHEYCHNFLGIDRRLVGPDYCLRFAAPVVFENLRPVLRRMLPRLLRRIKPGFVLDLLLRRMMAQEALVVDGRKVTWNATPARPFFNRLAGFSRTPDPQWSLTYRRGGLTASETDDFHPSRVVLWGTRHVVSAEVYVDVDLESGQAQTWTRRYQFDRDDWEKQ
jgi:hypothetical protein